jgi:ribosomal protein S18 acetylase RimI-like enzyme
VELFDETYGAPPSSRTGGARSARSARSGAAVVRDASAESDYEFLGLFDKRNRLVGYACFGPTPGTDRGYDLYWIAVNPAVQGAGGGTFLIGEVERQLGERNARFVLAETSSRSEYAATRAFYVARGYAEAARVREFYGPADDLVLFTKRLQPAPRSRLAAGGGGQAR